MSTVRAYDEIIDFIAGGTTPHAVAHFRPSEAVRQRVAELIAGEKAGRLSSEETLELDRYLALEHLMRLAKARALRFASDE